MSLDLTAFETPTRNNPNDAIFISFEGIEGAGKSTQIQLLKDYLENKKGLQVTVMREPGGTTAGEKLREAILKSSEKLTPLTETLIFLASRSELISQKITPLLSKPKNVVILDRYIDSTLSYQGVARGLGLEAILSLHRIPPLNLFPHKTFYLTIDEKTSNQRQKIRGQEKDYFEKQDHNFYRLIRQGFDKLSQLFASRYITIKADKSIEEVHKEIVNNWEKNFS